MPIRFTKMHGLGNDFMVVNAINQKFQPTPALIRQWSDRHTGIGFDQLLIAEPAKNPKADFFYRIYNADGTESAQCGNGARCLACFLHVEKLTTKNVITVETLAGLLELNLENSDQVTVNMGAPIFEPAHIPFITQQQANIYQLKLENQTIEFCALSMGNPHCVIIVPDIDTAPVKELGAQLSTNPAFPEQVNVGFMQIIDKNNIRLRVYERGIGETLACGSGACAAVVAGHLLGLLATKVCVQQPGGQLQITCEGINQPVLLTGPATTVYQGELT